MLTGLTGRTSRTGLTHLPVVSNVASLDVSRLLKEGLPPEQLKGSLYVDNELLALIRDSHGPLELGRLQRECGSESEDPNAVYAVSINPAQSSQEQAELTGSEINVGSKVVCIDASDTGGLLTLRKTYVVTRKEVGTLGMGWAVSLQDVVASWSMRRFMLASEVDADKPELPREDANEILVGSRVRCINDENVDKRLKKDKTYVVADKEPADPGNPDVYYLILRGVSGKWSVNRFELVRAPFNVSGIHGVNADKPKPKQEDTAKIKIGDHVECVDTSDTALAQGVYQVSGSRLEHGERGARQLLTLRGQLGEHRADRFKKVPEPPKTYLRCKNDEWSAGLLVKGQVYEQDIAAKSNENYVRLVGIPGIWDLPRFDVLGLEYRPAKIKLTYFKETGKLYASGEAEWVVQYIDNGSVYMYDIIALIHEMRLRSNKKQLPGLIGGWHGHILIDCENGYPCLIPAIPDEESDADDKADTESDERAKRLEAMKQRAAEQVVEMQRIVEEPPHFTG